MPDLICPFSVTLVQHDYACEHSHEIVRRGGAEAACRHGDMHATCSELHERMKSAALDTMGLEDDLLTLPHSVLVKIQYGGLLGLQRAMQTTTQSHAEQESGISSVASLVRSAVDRFTSMDDIPYDQTSQCIIEHKLQRRGSKNKSKS